MHIICKFVHTGLALRLRLRITLSVSFIILQYYILVFIYLFGYSNLHNSEKHNMRKISILGTYSVSSGVESSPSAP